MSIADDGKNERRVLERNYSPELSLGLPLTPRTQVGLSLLWRARSSRSSHHHTMDIDPLEPAYVQEVLSNPPFVVISGVYNVRDLAAPGTHIKPHFVFRGAEVSGITDEGEFHPPKYAYLTVSLHILITGKTQMRDLGITSVFDLRSDTEIEKYNTPLPVIDGVQVLQTPVFKTEDYSPEMMAKCVRVGQKHHLYTCIK